MDINHILPPKMILFLQKIKHDVIPIKGSWLGTIPKHFGLNNEIQNLEYLNKCDFLTCLWRLCSVNASQSTCQLHSDYNTQLFLVPGPENLTTQFMNNILPSFRADVAVCPSCASIVWAPGRCCSSPRPAVSHQKHQHLQEISCQNI